MGRRIIIPFTYFGGKAQPRIISWISSFFPRHHCYVEVFGGAGGTLLNKRPSEAEVYNDLNSALCDFFRVVADEKMFKQMMRSVALLPWSRELFMEYRRKRLTEKDIVRRVAMWYLVARQSFGGNFTGRSPSWSTGSNIDHIRTHWLNALPKLYDIHTRLQHVTIENLSFERLIPMYDSPTTFFYCDPPYVHSTRKSGEYAHEMDDAMHRQFLDLCKASKGMFLISGYDNDLYAKMLAGWKVSRLATNCFAKGSTRAIGKGKNTKLKLNRERTEVLWMNDALVKNLRRASPILEMA